MTDTAAPSNPWPELPIPDPETASMQQAADYIQELRKRIIEHGKTSVSDEELAAATRCMRLIRAQSTQRSRKAPSAPVKTLNLSDF